MRWNIAASVDPDKLKSSLQSRLESLHDLYSSNLISKSTLSSQLLELITTKEAKSFWDLTMKQDLTARRMLAMLEHPKRWIEDSSSPDQERLTIFKERLPDIFLQPDVPSDDLLEMLLDTACLPHFESSVFSRDSKVSSKKSGAKLSILD